MKKSNANNKSLLAPEGITRLIVSGYKSIRREQAIEIRPLTILAGTNSSGKSSMMQPLLLLKQTLEASYDPGALLLDGPHVRFTLADQLLSRHGDGKQASSFQAGIEVASKMTLSTVFSKQRGKGFDVQEMSLADQEENLTLHRGMTHPEILSALPPLYKEVFNHMFQSWSQTEEEKLQWSVLRSRCFLSTELTTKNGGKVGLTSGLTSVRLQSALVESWILQVIHLPGWRGTPARVYPVTAVSDTFPGTFEHYVASVIARWQAEKDERKLEQLGRDLEKLGLTWKVMAKPINDTQVELHVGRLPRAAKGARDLVSIADVGFGVSQTLPVLVALQAARPGQMVYLEEPEIHLHPRAQSAMAQVLANAAKRGVRVVAETHSSLLLLGIQTLVAEGKLPPEMVKLHWFKRRPNDGATEVKSADLDETGAFGDWPEDFADVALESQSHYLDAAESRQWKH